MVTITSAHQYASRNLDALLEEGDLLVLDPSMAGTVNIIGAITTGGVKFPPATQLDNGSLQYCLLNNTPAELTLQDGADEVLPYSLQPGQVASFMLSTGGSAGGEWYLLSDTLVSSEWYYPMCRVAIPSSTGFIPAGALVGSTYTATDDGVLPALDGVTLVIGDRILILNGGSTYGFGGIWEVTSVGAVADKFVLTRINTLDIPSDARWGALASVSEGNTYGGTTWKIGVVGSDLECIWYPENMLAVQRIPGTPDKFNLVQRNLDSLDNNITTGVLAYGHTVLGVRHSISGTFSHSLISGYQNTVSDSSRCIVAGGDNTVLQGADYSAIFGQNHLVQQSSSFSLVAGDSHILQSGGSHNLVAGNDHTVGGSHNALVGNGHILLSGAAHNVVGGYQHIDQVGGNTYNAVFGQSNFITHSSLGSNTSNCIIAGSAHRLGGGTSYNAVFGFTNYVSSGTNSALVAGQSNQVESSGHSGVVGSSNTLINGSSYSALMGQSHTVSDGSTHNVVAGQSNSVSSGSTHNVVSGQNNEVQSYSVGNAVLGTYNSIKPSTDSASSTNGAQCFLAGANNKLNSIVGSSLYQCAMLGYNNAQWSGGSSLTSANSTRVYESYNTAIFGYNHKITSISNSLVSGQEIWAGKFNAGTTISFAFSGGEVVLSDSSSPFDSSFVGTTVQVSNAPTGGNNGSFVVTAATGSSITYSNASGATEIGTADTIWKTESTTSQILNSIVSGNYMQIPYTRYSFIAGENLRRVDGVQGELAKFTIQHSMLVGSELQYGVAGGSISNSAIVGNDIKARNYVSASGLFGAQHNLVSGLGYSIVAGYANTFTAGDPVEYSAVFGYGHNIRDVGYSIVSGSQHAIAGQTQFSTVSGYSHELAGTVNYSAIFGQDLTLSSSSQSINGCIWSGAYHTAGEVSYSAVFGYSNTLRNSTTTTLVSGYNNLADNGAAYSTILGEGNTLTNGCTHQLISGKGNQADNAANYGAVIGSNCTSTNGSFNTVVTGNKALASAHKCMHVHSGGHPEAEAGVVGQGQLVDRIPHSNTTLNATPVTLYLEGYKADPSSSEWVTLTDHAFVLVSYVIAKCTTGDSAGGVRSWKLETTVNNVGGTLSIIGTPITTPLHMTAVAHEADWTIVPAVSGGIFRFQATGHANDVVRWQVFSQGPEIGIS